MKLSKSSSKKRAVSKSTAPLFSTRSSVALASAFGLSILLAIGAQFATAGTTVPYQTPPLGNVIPTFTGLEITGDSKISGALRVGNYIAPATGNTLTVNSPAVNFTKDVSVFGTLTANTLNLLGSLIINKDLTVKGNTDTQKDLSVGGKAYFNKGISLGKGSTLSVFENALFSNGAYFGGGITIGGPLHADSNTENNPFADNTIHINSDVKVQADSWNLAFDPDPTKPAKIIYDPRNLTVTNGHISASSIGDIFLSYGTAYDVSTKDPPDLQQQQQATVTERSYINSYASCPGQARLISCSVDYGNEDYLPQNSTGTSVHAPGFTIVNGDTCFANNVTTSPYKTHYRARAVCFDPSK